jgi:hypothetical protein
MLRGLLFLCGLLLVLLTVLVSMARQDDFNVTLHWDQRQVYRNDEPLLATPRYCGVAHQWLYYLDCQHGNCELMQTTLTGSQPRSISRNTICPVFLNDAMLATQAGILVRMDFHGRESVPLTTDMVINPVLSPDGSHLVYESGRYFNLPDPAHLLYQLNLQTLQEQKLAEFKNISFVQWDAEVVFQGVTDLGESAIYRVVDGVPQVIIAGGRLPAVYGSEMLYLQPHNPYHADIMNGNRVIYPYRHSVTSLHWSSDGAWVLYTAEGGYYQMRPDGSAHQQLSPEAWYRLLTRQNIDVEQDWNPLPLLMVGVVLMVIRRGQPLQGETPPYDIFMRWK